VAKNLTVACASAKNSRGLPTGHLFIFAPPSPLPETSGADHRHRWPVRLTALFSASCGPGLESPWAIFTARHKWWPRMLLPAPAPACAKTGFRYAGYLRSDLPGPNRDPLPQAVLRCSVHSGYPLCTIHPSNQAIFETFISILPALLRSKLSIRSSVRRWLSPLPYSGPTAGLDRLS